MPHDNSGRHYEATAKQKWETDTQKYPTGKRRDIPGGVAQDFQNGVIVKVGNEEARMVRGEIGRKYAVDLQARHQIWACLWTEMNSRFCAEPSSALNTAVSIAPGHWGASGHAQRHRESLGQDRV